MKSYCRNCGKLEELDTEDFCTLNCKEYFIDHRKCGNCDGSGRLTIQFGETKSCNFCFGTGIGSYIKNEND
jgi:hypothetical protein